MREYKFRHWDEIKKEMRYGDNEFVLVKEINGLIPMQFTGLLDRHGKEIYEGDILNHDLWGKFKVEWDDLSAGFRAINHEPEFKDLNMAHAQLQRIRVIGNIYESPELTNPPTT